MKNNMKKNYDLKKGDNIEFNISTRINNQEKKTGRIINILKNCQKKIIAIQIKDSKKKVIYNKCSFSFINKI